MLTERRVGSAIWRGLPSPSLGVIVRNNPPYEQLPVGVVPGVVSFGVVVGLLYVPPPTGRCSSVWGRCRVVSRRRAALVYPQCHRRPLAPRVTNYFCRQYSPCQYPTGPSSCFGPPSSSPPVLVALHSVFEANRQSRDPKKSIFSVK